MNCQRLFAWIVGGSLVAGVIGCGETNRIGSSPAGGSNAASAPAARNAGPRAAGAGGQGSNPGRDENDAPPVSLQTGALQQQLDAEEAVLAAQIGLDGQGLLAAHPLPFETALGYAPEGALNLDLIQNSGLALDQGELAALTLHGFVISEQRVFSSFGHGYITLYSEDLPLYVTLDSVLEAVHRSYDDILKLIEEQALAPELSALLSGMRSRLRTSPPPGLSEENRGDVEFYLAVAQSLLQGATLEPALGPNAGEVAAFVQRAEAAEGATEVTLFGVERQEDFSQFKPRGHYEDSESLARYFRAMMWLGRVDFRIIDVNKRHEPIFMRRQFEAAAALSLLLDDGGRARFARIDDVIAAFVGESDSMRVPEMPKLLQELGVSDLSGVSSLPDARIAQAVIDGGYGAQRIASYIMVNGLLAAGTLPLNRSFSLFGQRYTLDSHVFSNVVFDRVLPPDGVPPRMLPNPLDVAYAALGNDQAAALLLGELDRYRYAPALESMRRLADEHPTAYWESSLYTLWLSALRGASPAAARAADPSAALPRVTRTEPWGRRILNMQLASWAELRHDTILYAKQSYTSSPACEFPDAYVDPYPEAWAALERYAAKGAAISSAVLRSVAPALQSQLGGYFAELGKTARTLREMAEREIAGQEFSAEQLAFIQETVSNTGVCAITGINGWYSRLHLSAERGVEVDPVVADVHTQPADEFGTPVGRILHVGVGVPRLLVATVDTCMGARAYAGLVSSYSEYVTDNYHRLTDLRWRQLFGTSEVAATPWTRDLGGLTPTQP